MQNQFLRTELIFGKDGMEKLYSSRVAVFGIGGVGGITVEALARSGVGTLDIIDNDYISISNINRQIYATHKTVGEYKVDVAKERILDINPKCEVNTFKVFYSPQTASLFDFSVYDYVVDAIDTVTGKIEIVLQSDKAKVPVISSMGAGNKVNAWALEVSDIYNTSVCPLAKVMRKELRARGVESLKVVYSKEPAIKPYSYDIEDENINTNRRQVPGSNAFVPPAAGLIIAGEVIKDIIGY